MAVTPKTDGKLTSHEVEVLYSLAGLCDSGVRWQVPTGLVVWSKNSSVGGLSETMEQNGQSALKQFWQTIKWLSKSSVDGVLLTSTEDLDMQWKCYLIDLLLQADQSLYNHSKFLVCISVSKSDLLLMMMLMITCSNWNMLSSELESGICTSSLILFLTFMDKTSVCS